MRKNNLCRFLLPENRLTQVDYDPGPGTLTTMATYRYDALGRRIESVVRIEPDSGGCTREVTTRYYYDGQNVIAEYDQNDAIQRSYVHGLQYVDERAVMRDHHVPTGQKYQDHYYLLGELYTVVGMADCRGWLEEAYVDDPYGDTTIYAWRPGDVNCDGYTNFIDTWMVGEGMIGSYNPWGDANLDGRVDLTDANLVQDWNGTQGPTQHTYSSVDNPYLFTGRTTDTLHASDPLVSNDPDFKRIQDNRNRMYDPKHGRWLQRDPLRYRDGMNLHQYVKSRPTNLSDAHGWQSQEECMCTGYPRDYPMSDSAACGQCLQDAQILWGLDPKKAIADGGPCQYACCGQGEPNMPLYDQPWVECSVKIKRGSDQGLWQAHYSIVVDMRYGNLGYQWQIDGGPGSGPWYCRPLVVSINQTRGKQIRLSDVPDKLPIPFQDYNSSCLCVLRAAKNWKARRAYGAVCGPNSNSAAACILKACDNDLWKTKPSGAWGWGDLIDEPRNCKDPADLPKPRPILIYP